MYERQLYKLDDGSIFADKIELALKDDTFPGISFMKLSIVPDRLYQPLLKALTHITPTGVQGAPTDPVAARLSTLLRVALKGALLLYGDQLLALFYGSDKHPHLARGEDVLDFYADQFTRLMLTWLLKQDITVEGTMQVEDTKDIFDVHEIVVTALKEPEPIGLGEAPLEPIPLLKGEDIDNT